MTSHPRNLEDVQQRKPGPSSPVAAPPAEPSCPRDCKRWFPRLCCGLRHRGADRCPAAQPRTPAQPGRSSILPGCLGAGPGGAVLGHQEKEVEGHGENQSFFELWVKIQGLPLICVTSICTASPGRTSVFLSIKW